MHQGMHGRGCQCFWVPVGGASTRRTSEAPLVAAAVLLLQSTLEFLKGICGDVRVVQGDFDDFESPGQLVRGVGRQRVLPLDACASLCWAGPAAEGPYGILQRANALKHATMGSRSSRTARTRSPLPSLQLLCVQCWHVLSACATC